MKNLTEAYLIYRRNLHVPAIHAIRQAREPAMIDRRATLSHIAWQEDCNYNKFAIWQEGGFDLSARVMIRHHKAKPNSCKTFLTSNPQYSHGGSWYAGVKLECFSEGVLLGKSSLWGIDYKTDQDLDKFVSDLAQEAIWEAGQKLPNNCGCY